MLNLDLNFQSRQNTCRESLLTVSRSIWSRLGPILLIMYRLEASSRYSNLIMIIIHSYTFTRTKELCSSICLFFSSFTTTDNLNDEVQWTIFWNDYCKLIGKKLMIEILGTISAEHNIQLTIPWEEPFIYFSIRITPASKNINNTPILQYNRQQPHLNKAARIRKANFIELNQNSWSSCNSCAICYDLPQK